MLILQIVDFQRTNLSLNRYSQEIFIRGDGHAETTLSNSGEKIDVISASKPVCIECEIDLRQQDIHIGSSLLNDFSKKRKKDLSGSEQQMLRKTAEKLRNNN